MRPLSNRPWFALACGIHEARTKHVECPWCAEAARELEMELEVLVAADQTWSAKQAHAWWDREGREALATLEAERARAAKERESGEEEHRLKVDVRHRGRR